MKHTPTPWHAPGMGEIHDADHNLIAHIAFSTGEHDDDQVGTEADAKFIVRACNSHDQLVEALRDILSGWRYIRESHGDLYGVGWDRAQSKAEAALDAAGEQS